MIRFELVEVDEEQQFPDFFYEPHTWAPYVSRTSANTVNVVRKLITSRIGDFKHTYFSECHTSKGYRVKCGACGWTGYRNGCECCCYDEWSYYCRPWSPGPGCPSGILWGCPKCNGHGFDWKVNNAH